MIKNLHPQKRRLNAIQTIKRVVLNTIRKTENKARTRNTGTGTSWFNSAGETEGDFGVAAGNYIDVTVSNEIFTVNLDLESAGTPGLNKVLTWKAADDYQWSDIAAIGYWSRTSTTVYLTNAGDEVKLNDGELLKLESDAASDIKIYSYVSGDTFGRLQIKSDGTIEWGSGSAALDALLNRQAVGQLLINDALEIVQTVQLNGVPALRVYRNVDTDASADALVEFVLDHIGDEKNVLLIDNDGTNVAVVINSDQNTGLQATIVADAAAIIGEHNTASGIGYGIQGYTHSTNNAAYGVLSTGAIRTTKWLDSYDSPAASPIPAPPTGYFRWYCDTDTLRAYAKDSSSNTHDLSIAHKQVWQMVTLLENSTSYNINFCYENNYSTAPAFTEIRTKFSATPSATTPVITDHFAKIYFRVSTPDGLSFSTDAEFILGNPFRKVGKAITAKFRMKLDAALTNSEALDSVYIFIQENGSSSNAVYSDITSLGTPLDTTWREFTVSTTSAGSWGDFCRWGIQVRCGNGTPLSGPYDEDIWIDVELVEITQWVA